MAEYVAALCRACWKVFPMEESVKTINTWGKRTYCCSSCYKKETIQCPSCKRTYLPLRWDKERIICRRCELLQENSYPPEFERREYKRVHENVRRAASLNLPATLTLDGWISTLSYFKEVCAYCLDRPYENMDHFIPLRLVGGTTPRNCIPACKECNKVKGQAHPRIVTSIPAEALDRVSRYLSSQ